LKMLAFSLSQVMREESWGWNGCRFCEASESDVLIDFMTVIIGRIRNKIVLIYILDIAYFGLK